MPIRKTIEGQPVDEQNTADEVLVFGGNSNMQFLLTWIPLEVGETMVLCRTNRELVWINKHHVPQTQLIFRTLDCSTQENVLDSVGMWQYQPIVEFLKTGKGLELSMHCNEPTRVGSFVSNEMNNPIQIRSIKKGKPDKLLCRYKATDVWEFLPYHIAKDYTISRVENMG